MIKLENGVQIPENAIQMRTTAAIDSYCISEPLRVVQYDQTLPVAAVQLIYRNQPYTIPQSAELNVRMQKPDGKGVYNPCLGSDENGVVYFAFTQQMTAVPGNGKVTIEVTANGVKNSAPIAVNVAENPVQEGKIESKDEFLTLKEILSVAQQWGKIVQDNAANIQQAVDNMEAIKGAPTAANRAEQAATNAEKYAKMAQQVSQGAVGFYPTEEALAQAHPTGVDGNWAIVGDSDSIWVWDGDSKAWLDTKTNIKLSDYYTKTESDSMYLGKQDKAQSAIVADSATNATNAQQLDGHTWEDIRPRAVSAIMVEASGGISMPEDVLQVPLKISYQSLDAGFTVSGGQIVVPKSGFVMVSMQVMFSSGIENTYVGVGARKNGGFALDYYEVCGAKGYGCIASMPRIVPVNAGDKIGLQVMRETSATAVKVGNSTRTGMTIQYV